MAEIQSPDAAIRYQYQYQYDLAALHTDATAIDLAAPFISAPDNDNDDENNKNVQAVRGVKRERELDNINIDADLYTTSEDKREHHNKHTRRCRARLKSKFDSLMATLPVPLPVHGEVKHKVQILDYTIEVFERLDEELKLLEWNLALKSHKHLLKWIIAQEDPVQAFVQLFCNKFGFVYAEVWSRRNKSGGGDKDGDNDNTTIINGNNGGNHHRTLSQGAAISNTNGNDGNGNSADGWLVDKFSCHQTSWVDEETLTEIITTAQKLIKSQTVLTNTNIGVDIQDGEMYHPTQIVPNHRVHSHNLRTCLLVPIFVMGDAAKIIALFDTRVNRTIERHVMQLAATIAGNIGNVFAANQHAHNSASFKKKPPIPFPIPISISPSTSPKHQSLRTPSSMGNNASATNLRNSSARPKT